MPPDRETPDITLEKSLFSTLMNLIKIYLESSDSSFRVEIGGHLYVQRTTDTRLNFVVDEKVENCEDCSRRFISNSFLADKNETKKRISSSGPSLFLDTLKANSLLSCLVSKKQESLTNTTREWQHSQAESTQGQRSHPIEESSTLLEHSVPRNLLHQAHNTNSFKTSQPIQFSNTDTAEIISTHGLLLSNQSDISDSLDTSETAEFSNIAGFSMGKEIHSSDSVMSFESHTLTDTSPNNELIIPIKQKPKVNILSSLLPVTKLPTSKISPTEESGFSDISTSKKLTPPESQIDVTDNPLDTNDMTFDQSIVPLSPDDIEFPIDEQGQILDLDPTQSSPHGTNLVSSTSLPPLQDFTHLSEPSSENGKRGLHFEDAVLKKCFVKLDKIKDDLVDSFFPEIFEPTGEEKTTSSIVKSEDNFSVASTPDNDFIPCENDTASTAPKRGPGRPRKGTFEHSVMGVNHYSIHDKGRNFNQDSTSHISSDLSETHEGPSSSIRQSGRRSAAFKMKVENHDKYKAYLEKQRLLLQTRYKTMNAEADNRNKMMNSFFTPRNVTLIKDELQKATDNIDEIERKSKEQESSNKDDSESCPSEIQYDVLAKMLVGRKGTSRGAIAKQRMKTKDPESYSKYLEKQKLRQQHYRALQKRAPVTPENIAKMDTRKEQKRISSWLSRRKKKLVKFLVDSTMATPPNIAQLESVLKGPPRKPRVDRKSLSKEEFREHRRRQNVESFKRQSEEKQKLLKEKKRERDRLYAQRKKERDQLQNSKKKVEKQHMRVQVDPPTQDSNLEHLVSNNGVISNSSSDLI